MFVLHWRTVYMASSVDYLTLQCAKMICHEGKPVAIREKLFKILTKAHQQCQHGGRDKTSAQVRRIYSWLVDLQLNPIHGTGQFGRPNYIDYFQGSQKSWFHVLSKSVLLVKSAVGVHAWRRPTQGEAHHVLNLWLALQNFFRPQYPEWNPHSVVRCPWRSHRLIIWANLMVTMGGSRVIRLCTVDQE